MIDGYFLLILHRIIQYENPSYRYSLEVHVQMICWHFHMNEQRFKHENTFDSDHTLNFMLF